MTGHGDEFMSYLRFTASMRKLLGVFLLVISLSSCAGTESGADQITYPSDALLNSYGWTDHTAEADFGGYDKSNLTVLISADEECTAVITVDATEGESIRSILKQFPAWNRDYVQEYEDFDSGNYVYVFSINQRNQCVDELEANIDSDYSNSSNSSASNFDIEGRLNQNSLLWEPDMMRHLNGEDIGLIDIWFSDSSAGTTCAVWAFNTLAQAEAASSNGTMPTGYGNLIWTGEDSLTGYGIGLITESRDAPCNQDVLDTFNWSYLE